MTKSRVPGTVTVDPGELRKFARMAEQWWDPEGEMKPLHALNWTRIAYLRERLSDHFGSGESDPMKPLKGLRILDAGCGGGLLAEPLVRLGADVVGLDAAQETIKAAKAHAEQEGLAIDYRCTTVETVAETYERFDAVLAMEVIEHVADIDGFLGACAHLVRPGGACVVATINRTPKSFLLAKLGAEYFLRWLPRGTHDWRRFVRPSEIATALRPHGLQVRDVAGVVFDPLGRRWRLGRDIEVNFMLFAVKP